VHQRVIEKKIEKKSKTSQTIRALGGGDLSLNMIKGIVLVSPGPRRRKKEIIFTRCQRKGILRDIDGEKTDPEKTKSEEKQTTKSQSV